MIKISLLKNVIIFSLIYILPILVFCKLWTNRGLNKIILFIISMLYIFLSMFTQNLLPFIITLICINYMRSDMELYKDYNTYNFSIRNIKIMRALNYSILSYMITIIIGTIAIALFFTYKIPLKEQEIVSYMSKLPLKKFIFMIPITVIFAPVVEEFVFRWLLFEKIFKNRIGIYLAAVVSSVVFSMVHFNIKSFPAILWIGLFNCFLIHKKGYWYAVFNHGFFNSISTFVLLFEKLGLIKL